MLVKKVVTECHRNFKLELSSNLNSHGRCALSNAWSTNFVLYRNVLLSIQSLEIVCFGLKPSEFLTTTIQKYLRTSV